MHLVSSAIGEINPFIGAHDAIVREILDEGQKHRPLAEALVHEPGTERWLVPLDRDRQVWIEPETRGPFPEPTTFPIPDRPPDQFEIYAQHPAMWVTTSTEIEGWTSQLANLVSGYGDWYMNYSARRARIVVSRKARVYEVVTAEDWHALTVQRGVRSQPPVSRLPLSWPGEPWGPNHGVVPDWQSVAKEWDGVHLTLWGYLTATQVRVTSDAGWSELWSWEGETTTWLRWAFEEVEPMTTLDTLPEGRHFPLPHLLRAQYEGATIVVDPGPPTPKRQGER